MKKLFALLVVLALAVSLFAACNSNEDTTTAPASETTTTPASESQTTPVESDTDTTSEPDSQSEPAGPAQEVTIRTDRALRTRA